MWIVSKIYRNVSVPLKSAKILSDKCRKTNGAWTWFVMLQWHNEPLFKFSLHKWGLGVNWPQKPMHQTPNISHHNLKFKHTTASAYLSKTRAEPKDLYYSAHVQCATSFFLLSIYLSADLFILGFYYFQTHMFELSKNQGFLIVQIRFWLLIFLLIQFGVYFDIKIIHKICFVHTVHTYHLGNKLL